MANIDKVAFSEIYLGNIKLKNKIIRSATHEGMADEDGFPKESLKKLYVRLAKGGAGAIITGETGVQKDGKSSWLNMLMIDNDEVVPALKELTDAVHEYETPIILQIAHCGRQTRSKAIGYKPSAPSAKRHKFYSEDLPKKLSEIEIEGIIDNFVKAAQRAKQAGFDGVQLHLAHGFLLSDFLSSHSNNREDQWGGSIENKYRIINEIFNKIRTNFANYPVLVKMNAHDGQKRGMNIAEAVELAKMLEKSGCAAIEVSCGTAEDGLYFARSEKLPVEAVMEYNFKYKNLPGIVKSVASPFLKILLKQPKPLLKYNLDAAIQIKQAVKIPVIVVGGINNVEDINSIIERDGIDCVSMCRPFITEPNIVNKFKKGTQAESKCIMCNYCTMLGEAKPLKCYFGKLPGGT
jgi:2,4-dienoyl-CoA reductase-like NADH-dependent reductase (Old Yellow Enzyme family)